MPNAKPVRRLIPLVLVALGVTAGIWSLRASRERDDLPSKANQAIAAGRPEEAIRYLSLHLESNPRDNAARLRLARMLAVSEPQQALAHLREIPEGGQEGPEARKLTAGVLMQLERDEEALNVLTDLVRTSPDDFAVRLSLAELHYKAGNYERALTQIERAIELNSEVRQAYDLQAHLLDELNRQPEMVDPLRRSLELDPHDAETRLNLSYALRYAGKLDEAEAATRRVLEARPDWSQAWFELAVTLKERGSTSDALQAVENCLKFDGNLFVARLLKTELLLFQDRYGEAFGELRPLYPQHAHNRRLLALLSRAAILSGKTEFARELNEKLRSIVDAE